ncbi:MAG: lipopolysaccharide biosynthesis protein, partial [Devosia sp.]|nr:lipopolysaccharide biosynthesis protein [Devosia sp.]
ALVAPDLIPFAFGESWISAVPVVQAFCVLGLLTAVGILQSSLIRSQGHANLWFYYILGKQAVTVLYIFLFAGWGVVALTNSLVILNLTLWLPTLYMVVRMLDISAWTYLRSFALPVFATIAMGICGWLVQLELANAEPLLRLATTIGAAALSYGAIIVVLGRGQIKTLTGFVRRRR